MKSIWKYIIGIAVVAIIVIYAVFGRQTPAASPSTTSSDNTGTGSGAGSTSTAGTTGTGSGAGTTSGTGSATTTTGSGAQAGMYKDGSYTGTAADAFYGTIQVKAIISGGALTDVQFLQEPDAPGHTSQVSATALPELKQEAITAQSANVNVVSGATQDSQAFQQSLAAALALATN